MVSVLYCLLENVRKFERKTNFINLVIWAYLVEGQYITSFSGRHRQDD